jgi:hypothetical protein
MPRYAIQTTQEFNVESPIPSSDDQQPAGITDSFDDSFIEEIP